MLAPNSGPRPGAPRQEPVEVDGLAVLDGAVEPKHHLQNMPVRYPLRFDTDASRRGSLLSRTVRCRRVHQQQPPVSNPYREGVHT